MKLTHRNRIKRNPVPLFQRLQMRLTLSFVIANVVATIAIITILTCFATYLIYFSPLLGLQSQEDLVTGHTPKLAAFLDGPTIDRTGLRRYIQTEVKKQQEITRQVQRWRENPDERPPDQDGLFLLAFKVGARPIVHTTAYLSDTKGNVIAKLRLMDKAWELVVLECDVPVRAEPIAPYLTPDERPLIARALSGETGSANLVSQVPGVSSSAVAPIFSRTEPKKVVGVLFLRLNVPFSPRSFLWEAWGPISSAAALVALSSGLVGSAFGYFMSRRLTRRLNAIASAADAWAHGHFDVQAPTQGGDELALLATRLNHMAIELHDLLALRQDIATLEERHRLARDLHDTVKQQVFALTMQLGAARSLLNRDTNAAGHRLADAEQLARQTQHELMTLLQELRPTYQENKTLADHLNEIAQNWERQTGISVRLHLEDSLIGVRFAPRTELALLRIAQEALSNVARHSRATSVDVLLKWNGLSLCLQIADNGRGFDNTVSHTTATSGMGLSNMRERAEALPGGRFSLTTAPGDGTTILVFCSAERAL